MKNYQQRELWPVYNTFESEGFEITMAGSEIGTAVDGGDSIEIDEEFSNLSGDTYDGIVIIGGSGVKDIWDNNDLHELINQVYDSGGVAAAICLAPLTLANAGVLKDEDSACWYSSSDINSKMKALGIIDSKQDVTVSGRIITGNGPDAAKQFADEVALALKSIE
jgi:protease I